jgi:hypothetical protein
MQSAQREPESWLLVVPTFVPETNSPFEPRTAEQLTGRKLMLPWLPPRSATPPLILFVVAVEPTQASDAKIVFDVPSVIPA